MKLALASVLAAASFLFAGDGPASRPTSQPATRPAKKVIWSSVIRSLPREMRPQRGQEWAFGEGEKAAEWVGRRADGFVTSFRTEHYYWNGGEWDAAYRSQRIEVWGVEWQLDGRVTFKPSERAAAGRRREDNSVGISGQVSYLGFDFVESGKGTKWLAVIRADISNASIE